MLVHASTGVDPKLVWAHLDHLDDLTAFAAAISSFLDEGASPSPGDPSG